MDSTELRLQILRMTVEHFQTAEEVLTAAQKYLAFVSAPDSDRESGAVRTPPPNI